MVIKFCPNHIVELGPALCLMFAISPFIKTTKANFTKNSKQKKNLLKNASLSFVWSTVMYWVWSPPSLFVYAKKKYLYKMRYIDSFTTFRKMLLSKWWAKSVSNIFYESLRRRHSHTHTCCEFGKGCVHDGLSHGYYVNIDMDGRMDVARIRIINWRKQIVS